MIPNIYVVGVTKCATTSLYEALKEQGQASVCQTHKENTFFLRDYHFGKDYLDKLYPDGFENCVDFHPNNFLVDHVPPRIKEVNPDAKIIMIIREPVARAYSEIMHFHKMRPGRETEPDQAIMDNYMDVNPRAYPTERDYVLQIDPRGGFYDQRYIERGLYAEHIYFWRQYFPNMEVFVFEEIIKGGEAMQRLCDVLGVDYLELPKVNSKTNGGGFRDDIKTILKSSYDRHNKVLAEMLNQDLEKIWYGE